MYFRITMGNREQGVGWQDGIRHRPGCNGKKKKSDEKPHAEIGLKVHTRLYRQKSTQRFWDYSETRPKEPRWNISRLTAQLCRPPWIWTLRMAATDWALSQRANAKNPALLTQCNYTIMLSNTPVNQPLVTAVYALNNRSPVYHFSCFKSHFHM